MIKCFYCDSEAEYIFDGISLCVIHLPLQRHKCKTKYITLNEMIAHQNKND